MEENKAKETNCPECDKHCPKEELKCGRGRRYFGIESPEGEKGGHERHEGGRGGRHGHRNHNASPAEKIIDSLRQSGHYLHHNFGNGEELDCEAMLSALNREEQEQLAALLGKCIAAWDK